MLEGFKLQSENDTIYEQCYQITKQYDYDVF